MAAPEVHHLFHAPIADHSFSADRSTLAVTRDNNVELYQRQGSRFALQDELRGHDKLITGVDMRVYPMFAFLFGYGLAVIYRRQGENGVPEREAFRLLQRRNLWLLVFGFVHALLLWGGDVLGAYGLCGLVLVWLFIRRADRTLLIWAGVGATLLLLMGAFSLLGGWATLTFAGPDAAQAGGGGMTAMATASASADTVLGAAMARITMWPFIVIFQGLFGLAVPTAVLLGFWAARRRVLERPAEFGRFFLVLAVEVLERGQDRLHLALAHPVDDHHVVGRFEPADTTLDRGSHTFI